MPSLSVLPKYTGIVNLDIWILLVATAKSVAVAVLALSPGQIIMYLVLKVSPNANSL